MSVEPLTALSPARRSSPRSSGDRLREALLALGDYRGRVLTHTERAWASITFAGTMRMSMPTLLLVEKAGVTTYYARGDGGYQAIPRPNAPIIMRARVRTGNHPDGQGVRLFYPAWSAKVLSGLLAGAAPSR